MKDFKDELLKSAEGIEMCEEKLREFYIDLERYNQLKNQGYDKLISSEKDVRWVAELEIEDAQKAIDFVKTNIRRFEYLKKVAQDKAPPAQFDLSQVKAVPISTLLGKPVREDSHRGYYKCPLHNENSPSFTWYKGQNSWYCFGCCVGGSVVDLYMKLHEVDFKTSCKQLSTM